MIPPFVVLLTRKKSKSVVVTCPGCLTELKLGRLRNYKCPKCHDNVDFFNPKTGKLKEGIQFVICSNCNMENVNGLKLCIRCDTELELKREEELLDEQD